MEKTKKINQTIIIISWLLVFFTSSCTSCGEFSSKIKKLYKDEQIGKPVIDLKDVFKFEWDTLYIVHENNGKDYIEQYLNVDCDCDYVPDGTFMYLFVKDKKLVKKSIQSCQAFWIQPAQKLGRGGIEKITSSHSKFEILKEDESIDFYILKPFKE